jgi:EAL domain-containing protein (putative c-di-GMP-specific phosphodiesterase class I)
MLKEESSSAPTVERVDEELLAELRSALADRSLSLCYQPVVRSGDGEIIGFESLLRWTRPTGGHITLIVEGVESEQEMSRVAALGFAYAQGYAFGRPDTAGGVGRSLAGDRWNDART